MDQEPLLEPTHPSTGVERRRLLSTVTGTQEADDAALLALVRDVGEGSPAAFERFWHKVERRVWMIVRLRVGATLARLMESEDVMQEIALAVWQAAPTFRPAGAGSVYAWVATIVENRVRGLGRAAGAAKRGSGKVRRIESQAGGSLSGLALFAKTAGPMTRFASAERDERIARVLERLPERSRELLVMHQFEDLSWNEIASRAGFPSADAARMSYTRTVVPFLLSSLRDLDRP